MFRDLNVCVLGGGNLASAVAKIVGVNCAKSPEFKDCVPMYVFQEQVDGYNLSDIINCIQENVKYLPGHKLPPNVVATPDASSAVSSADILIFVLPNQFLSDLCDAIRNDIKPGAIGISLIKDYVRGGVDCSLNLPSHFINSELEIPCSVLSGANLAYDLAQERFCEATLGCRDFNTVRVLRDLFQTDNLRVYAVEDVEAVEVCAVLKNVVACGVGVIDGLCLGDNTKSAAIRLGLMEIIKFVQLYYPSKMITFLQSCCVADLISSCYGGCDRMVAEEMAKTGKPIDLLEVELLNGQKLQGPATAAAINHMLKTDELEHEFPLFTAVHKICASEMRPEQIINHIRYHPENDQQLKLDTREKRRIVSWMKPTAGPPIKFINSGCSICGYHTAAKDVTAPLKRTPQVESKVGDEFLLSARQRQKLANFCHKLPQHGNLQKFSGGGKTWARLAFAVGTLGTLYAIKMHN